MKKKRIEIIVVAILIFVNSISAFTIEFNGTVKDFNGNPLNNSVVNLTVRNVIVGGVIGYNSTTTNASGWFNITLVVPDPSVMDWVYEPRIIYRNTTTNSVQYISKSLPAFPVFMFQMLAGTNFYLYEAGTINISVVNRTGNFVNFSYQIKDTKLGYPIAENFNVLGGVNNALIYVPKDRNYSIMVYPQESVPVSFEWNNFSSTNDLTGLGSGLGSYNATTRTLKYIFNSTLSMPRVSGYINFNGINGWDYFKIVPYLLEAGNMVHAEYGTLPYNLSSFEGGSDIYNLSTGFFNITLPATVENSRIILFATARNGSRYVGSFRNVSLSYNDYISGGELTNFNFSMYDMFGEESNITMEKAANFSERINITTKRQVFNLVNESNITLENKSAHIEAKVDYSNFGAIEFSWMVDTSETQGPLRFYLPLINVTGIKEINIFINDKGGGGPGSPDAKQTAPRRISFTASQITQNTNITNKVWSPRCIGNNNCDTWMSLYISNSTCDVPNPPMSCELISSLIIGGSAPDPEAERKPMQAVIGGGKVTFRIGTGNITVVYVNADMLASGPPEALFDESTTNYTSANSFESVLKFGSSGPKIYDYVLVSIPYVDGSDNVSELNDSSDVHISIPYFYDDNWNIIWNSSLNGTNASALAGNYSHYSNYLSQWQILMQENNCTRNQSELNSTNPCYIDTISNKIWIRLPHFSGTAPKISGASIFATSSSSSSGDGGGGSGSSTSYWINTQSVTEKQFEDGYTYELAKRYRIQFVIDKKFHYLGVVSLTETTATINISSNSFQEVFNIGDEKKFDLNEDKYYDIYVKLNDIKNNKANITIKKIYEEIKETTANSSTEKTKIPTGSVTKEEKNETLQEEMAKTKSSVGVYIVGIILLIITGIIIYVLIKKRKYQW